MADLLPAFLQFTRKPRRTTEARTGEDLGVEGSELSQSAAPAPLVVPAKPKPAAPPAPAYDPAAAAAPEPVAPVEPTATAAVSPAERRAMGPAPLMRNARGESMGRPEYDDTGDRPADLENYRRGLEGQRNPEDRDGRVKTALKEAALGFIMGGPRGAIVRGVRGAVTPNVNERRERDREIGRVEGEQAKEAQRQGWAAKLADAQADTDLKRANAEYARKRPEIESERNDLRESIAREGFETRRAIATMQDSTKRSEGDANRVNRKEVAGINTASRERVAASNLKYREKRDAASLAERRREHADRMELGRASLSERIAARVSAEAARKVGQGQAATRVKISLARAKAWAEKEGAGWDEFVDGLDENGIEIVPDK